MATHKLEQKEKKNTVSEYVYGLLMKLITFSGNDSRKEVRQWNALALFIFMALWFLIG